MMHLETKLSDFIKIVKPAKELATKAHKGTYRKGKDKKGNKIEYIKHPEAVAKIVRRVKNSKQIAALIAAAYLHDTVEDTDVIYDDITDLYGDNIFKNFPVDDIDKESVGELIKSLVKELTSDPDKIEKMGKTEYLTQKMLRMSSWALVIKLADRLHNLSDIPQKMKGSPSDIRWAKKYSNQTKHIIDTLKEERDLSKTQLDLVKMIEDKIKLALV